MGKNRYGVCFHYVDVDGFSCLCAAGAYGY